ncbi:ribosomal RNA small subunit methyltransferase, mitochondrial [Magnolia sinica]|uniref:ribosomal RNA small subunit methyltransferase, mitochondrial n=1 Tax=Magnolia sinica TaxID=86752 RepID=UPI00265823B0|nr:ribosomal RNA small subunit methyltransferase, mitochondrial [Magnolia sinica]
MLLRRAKSFSTNLSISQWKSLPYSRKASRFRDSDDDEDRNARKRKAREGGGDESRIYLHKSRGQHILTNPRILHSIVQRADVRPTDTVLEIGPGTGNLTLKLLESAQKVFAVEIDKRMVEILHTRVADRQLDDRLTVICKDALKTQFPEFDLCVANIPYGISSPLIVKLLFGGYTFRSATLLLQKEFARRLLANPGDSAFNRLAVNVKLVATVEFVMDVSKKDFIPCPKVDSSVVRIQPKSAIPNVDLDEWRAFTRTCFGNKNRTLGAILKQKRKVMELLRVSQSGGRENDNDDNEDNEDGDGDEDEDGIDDEEEGGDLMEMAFFKEKILGVLKENGYEEKRPSKLSVEELLHLLSLFNQVGVHFHGCK